jgi:ABC-type polysaccharide/polyol phosphate transport system ATPase subunit
MSRPAILVEDVAVKFRPYADRKPTLRRTLNTMRHREVIEVNALDGVSFQVEKGEAFGIIGSNGAGKSTLLRCVARTLRPDRGRVVVNGKISSLLQLGVGFNAELSGRRNIFLGGLANGLRLKEIQPLVQGIIDFAELEEAIDRPVKTYSSGMFSRLAFSISMALEPDIILLDEVLAVGDEKFRTKSMATMEDLLAKSGTIVFVSHSLASVEEFCDRVMWLDKGKVEMIGPSEEVIEAYRTASKE